MSLTEQPPINVYQGTALDRNALYMKPVLYMDDGFWRVRIHPDWVGVDCKRIPVYFQQRINRAHTFCSRMNNN